MRQIVDNVYTFPFGGGFMNVFLIETESGLMLIDTATSGDHMRQVAETLQKNGRSVNEVKHIFITHAHFDHIGGLAELQKLTNAQTYAHRREAAIIRGEAEIIYAKPEDLGFFMRFIQNFMVTSRAVPARVDTEVKQGDKIAGEFEVIELPGHAYGHLGLWWPERRILFGGDVVARLPWGMSLPFAAATPDMPEAKRSVKKIAAMNVETLCICHGKPIVGNASAVLQKFAAKI